jgi:excisionase family DNA binding protein
MPKSKASSTPTATPISLGDLLTTEQVAQILGVGSITIKRRVWRGELKCIYLSKSCVRFSQADVDAYLVSKRS